MNNKIELRPYQKAVIEKLKSIYSSHPKDKRAFLEMPTGTGKTWTALHMFMDITKSKGKSTVAWVAHESELVKQSYNDFMEYIGEPPLEHAPNGPILFKYKHVTIKFCTWQALRNTKDKLDLLIIDECHRGSSNDTNGKNAGHKSFKKILKLCTHHLYVSATPWNLNPEVYPGLLTKEGFPKAEFHALYDQESAYRDNFICNIQFKVIQTADTIKIKKLNDEQNRGFETMGEGSEIISKDKINIKDVRSRKALNESVLHSLLTAYFHDEMKDGKLPPTIVYCATNLESNKHLTVKEAARAIKKRAAAKGINTGSRFVDYITAEDTMLKDGTKKLDAFREGKINILCVVGMAREGFNYKELEVALDLSPNFDNERMMVQKIGRPIRKKTNGIDNARYYYPDTFQNYVTVNGVKKEFSESQIQEMKSRLSKISNRPEEEITLDEVNSTLNVIANTGALQNQKDGENVGACTIQGQKELPDDLYKGSLKKTKVTVTEVDYIVTDADNTDPLKNIKFSYWFSNLETKRGSPDVEGNKKAIIEWGVKYKNRPKRRPSSKNKNSIENNLADRLASYLREYSPCYDKEFSNKIKKLYPNWFLDTIKMNQTLLEDKYYSKGKIPPNKTKLSNQHGDYHNKNKRHYKKDWSESMVKKYPKLFASRLEKSFNNFISKMPKNIKFKEGQKWLGTRGHEYIFIDSELGEFKRKCDNILVSWKSGYGGHRTSGLKARGDKRKVRVKNIDTKEIFDSLITASEKYKTGKSNIISAIIRGHKCAGFRWAYVD